MKSNRSGVNEELGIGTAELGEEQLHGPSEGNTFCKG